MTTKNFRRQIGQVQNLANSPRQDCTVTRFEVIDCRDYVHVTRAFAPNHAPSLSYTECFSVGPRGGAKLIYSSNNF